MSRSQIVYWLINAGVADSLLVRQGAQGAPNADGGRDRPIEEQQLNAGAL
jgi:hypothetical protein